MDAEFEARIGAGDVVFDADDAALLRAVDEHGSLNAATDALGRSFAHAQRRVVELEEAFGTLVERRRGGSGGGGSELADGGRRLLAEFARLRAEFDRVAGTEWTVIPGTVVERAGELATVETAVGPVRAIASGNATDVDVTIRADAVTLSLPAETPAAGETSALNRFEGTVAGVDRGETVAVVTVAVGDERLTAFVTEASVDRLELRPGAAVVAAFKATATRAVPAAGAETGTGTGTGTGTDRAAGE
ncbi:molybdenum-binding protein [Halobacteriales archaeon QS_1_68_17]|nr:MAG: molybdenum-binding protein [Halobacteriales archaeon QS_1_68_17]